MAQIKKSLIGMNSYVRWNLHSLHNCCLHNTSTATGRREGGELPLQPRAAGGAADLTLGPAQAGERSGTQGTSWWLIVVLLPHHLIWCLSKACVGFRCMCSSYWIQWHFLTTRIQLSAVNGPSILKTPIAFSKYSLNSSYYWLGLSGKDICWACCQDKAHLCSLFFIWCSLIPILVKFLSFLQWCTYHCASVCAGILENYAKI